MYDSMNDIKPDYLRMRLNKTVVRHKELNEPVLLEEVVNVFNDHFLVEGFFLHEDGMFSSDTLDSRELVIDDMPLGYLSNSSLYTTRCPLREDWRQGLRRNNIVSVRDGITDNLPFGDTTEMLIELRSPFKNLYKGFASVKDFAARAAVGHYTPIHRDWAGRSGVLCWKGWNVGKFTRDDFGSVTLLDEWKFLSEDLEEALEGMKKNAG